MKTILVLCVAVSIYLLVIRCIHIYTDLLKIRLKGEIVNYGSDTIFEPHFFCIEKILSRKKVRIIQDLCSRMKLSMKLYIFSIR